MGETAIVAVSATTLLNREDRQRTKHDPDFSQWKILIEPRDWEDYLLNKEGAERYRTQNLPNCSSCSGVYELGIVVLLPQSGGKSSSKLSSKHVLPVYLGQADNVRTRLQQYGRDGAHLENGCSNGEPNGRKVFGLFSDIFSNGFAIAYRWAPKESKKAAEERESQLLKIYDYAWNRGKNGERRLSDIHQKLPITSSSKRLPQVFKFNRSNPVLVSKEFDINGSDASKGMRINNPSLPLIADEKDHLPSPGVDSRVKIGPFYTTKPVIGRKSCQEHKGMRDSIPSIFSDSGTVDNSLLTCGAITLDGSSCNRKPGADGKFCWQHESIRSKIKHSSCENSKAYSYSSTCGAITLDGSFCKRKPGADGKFCWQHESTRAMIKHSSWENSNAYSSSSSSSSSYSYSSTCGAMTKRGTLCMRPTTGGQRCFQH